MGCGLQTWGLPRGIDTCVNVIGIATGKFRLTIKKNALYSNDSFKHIPVVLLLLKRHSSAFTVWFLDTVFQIIESALACPQLLKHKQHGCPGAPDCKRIEKHSSEHFPPGTYCLIPMNGESNIKVKVGLMPGMHVFGIEW